MSEAVIQKAAQNLKSGKAKYSDLAIIEAAVELGFDVNPERVERLGNLAWRRSKGYK